MPIGATMHLGFLRDLFVCILLTPILIPAVQRMPWLMLGVLGLFYLFEHNQASVIILRPLVLFAFVIGITLAVRRSPLNAWDKYCPLFVVLTAISTVSIMMVNDGAVPQLVNLFARYELSFDETVLYPLGRLFGSLAIWTYIPVLLGGRFQKWVNKYSPYLFAAFCSHYLMLTVLFFAGWYPVFGDRESVFFIVWFLSAPFVSMGIAVLIVHAALKIAPPLAGMLTGGRVTETIADEYASMAQRRYQGIA